MTTQRTEQIDTNIVETYYTKEPLSVAKPTEWDVLDYIRDEAVELHGMVDRTKHSRLAILLAKVAVEAQLQLRRRTA